MGRCKRKRDTFKDFFSQLILQFFGPAAWDHTSCPGFANSRPTKRFQFLPANTSWTGPGCLV